MGDNRITLYYWPFMIRGAACVRILEHTGTDYDYISSKEDMAKVCSTWGANGTTFAPPVIVDGEKHLSQQIACTAYLGDKLLTDKSADFDPHRNIQFMLDVVDLSENGIGKSNEDGPTLNKYLNGDRFKAMAGNIERSIKGPYYFGDKPAGADFFLLAHMDWRCCGVFDPIKAKYGEDHLAQFPKICNLLDLLRSTSAYQNCKHKMPGPIKEEILNSYM